MPLQTDIQKLTFRNSNSHPRTLRAHFVVALGVSSQLAEQERRIKRRLSKLPSPSRARTWEENFARVCVGS